MTRPHRRLALAAALAALALPAAHAAAPVPLVSFEDEPGDADGDLDLRRFAVLADGDDLLLVATLGAPLPPGGLVRQALHLYLDTDATPGAGSTAALPGPKVAFAGGRTWEAAVLLSPRPDEARGEVRRALGAAADRVAIPATLSARGRALTARLPAAALGGRPGPGWGYALLVVDAVPAGGARVRDVLLPEGADQGRLLLGSPPAIPFQFGPALMIPPPEAPVPAAAPAPASPVPPPADAPPATPSVSLAPNLMPRLAPAAPREPPAAAPAAPVALVVTDLSGELLTAKGTASGVRAMQFGRVVDAQGIAVARVMVLRVLDEGLLATVIAGQERVRTGQALLVDPAPAGAPGP